MLRRRILWLYPTIGGIPVADVKNSTLKVFVEELHEAGLAPKSIRSYAKLMTMVIASAIDQEGEQLYPRKWNYEFADLTVVDETKQHTPSFIGEQVTQIVWESRSRDFMVSDAFATRIFGIRHLVRVVSSNFGWGVQTTCRSDTTRSRMAGGSGRR
jgi:hypothetical protein